MTAIILRVSQSAVFRGHPERALLRGVMVFIFYAFAIQKWTAYTAQMLVPLISHSPLVFWMEPVFGVRGAGYCLGTTETIFGTLILLGFWNPRLGVLGAAGSVFTFIGTTGILLFLPGIWARQAGGFPIMTLPAGFLLKDVLFLAVSFYLLRLDLLRAAAVARPAPGEVGSGSAEGHALEG